MDVSRKAFARREILVSNNQFFIKFLNITAKPSLGVWLLETTSTRIKACPMLYFCQMKNQSLFTKSIPTVINYK